MLQSFIQTYLGGLVDIADLAALALVALAVAAVAAAVAVVAALVAVVGSSAGRLGSDRWWEMRGRECLWWQEPLWRRRAEEDR